MGTGSSVSPALKRIEQPALVCNEVSLLVHRSLRGYRMFQTLLRTWLLALGGWRAYQEACMVKRRLP